MHYTSAQPTRASSAQPETVMITRKAGLIVRREHASHVPYSSAVPVLANLAAQLVRALGSVNCSTEYPALDLMRHSRAVPRTLPLTSRNCRVPGIHRAVPRAIIL
jgi:hypothetical protein